MILVDSSVWIDSLRGRETKQTRLLQELAARGEVGVPDMVLYEVLQGVPEPGAFAAVQAKLLGFDVLPVGGKELTLKAARNSLALRRLGRQTSAVDCFIATCCIEGGHALLTSDADFLPYAEHLGLKLVR